MYASPILHKAYTLRQELAASLHRNKQLEEKINTASSRLENILKQIPVEET